MNWTFGKKEIRNCRNTRENNSAKTMSETKKEGTTPSAENAEIESKIEHLEPEVEVLAPQTETEENTAQPVAEGDLPDPIRVELELKKAELAQAKGDFLRLAAEFDNFRKRNARERSELLDYAGMDILKALLPVLDDFGRTLQAIEKTDNLTSIREGINMVNDNLYKILGRQGLTPIESKGLPFDSAIHEAIGSFEAEPDKKGMVLEEAERGYKLKEKVIRYAKVIVGE